jgi:hypothetical protein
MVQNKTFNKIQTFVKEQINSPQGSVIITETANGYKVNDLYVQQTDSAWIVKNNRKIELGRFKNKRLAVLSAALTVRKMFQFSQLVALLDVKLTNLKHDKSLFENKIAKSYKKELFEDRYSRTSFELSSVYNQILELEKSARLQ